MPYLVESITVDQYGRKHPVGKREIVDAITNPLALANRTIGLAPQECSTTFRLDRARKYAATLSSYEEKAEFILDVVRIFNPREYEETLHIYEGMSQKEKERFIDDCISLKPNGTIDTSNGVYIRWEPFSTDQSIRDSCIELEKKYPGVFKPYHVFNPKPNWGRDVYIGEHHVGYQYMMMLKQSARKGFIVRSGGAISDEGLPEKTNSKKIGTSWASSKPIRYGEYETPGFLVITQPEDFAMFTALYRSSLDGRKYLCEAVLQGDGFYNLPDYFVSRTVQILQVYLKQLGVGMDCVNEDDELIIFPEDLETQVEYELQDCTILCSIAEREQLKQINRVYRRYLKENNWGIVDVDDAWEYVMKHLPFKKKELLPDVPDLFRKNIQYFAR